MRMRFFRYPKPTSFAKNGFLLRLDGDDTFGQFERTNDQNFKSDNKRDYMDISREEVMLDSSRPIFLKDDADQTFKLIENESGT